MFKTLRFAMSVFGLVTAVAAAQIVAAPPALAATGDPVTVTATVQGLNVAVGWTVDPSVDVTGYIVTTQPTSPSVSVPAAATSATLTGVRPGIDYRVSVSAVRSGSQGSAVAAPQTVRTAAPGGTFAALAPSRLLDTRSAVGAPAGLTSSLDLQVTGRGGVPLTGVSAVVMNLTVTLPSGDGWVTAYPTGESRPNASNVNFTKGQSVANLVVVPVGAGGKVTLFSAQPTHFVADVSGYFTTTATASSISGLFQPLSPVRLMDTRNGFGASTPGSGQQVKIKVTGTGGVPASNVSAVVLNTTVVAPSTPGYLTVYPTGSSIPLASTINFTAGQVVANRTIVRVGTDGYVSFYNPAGNTPVVVDVAGWFTSNSDQSASGSYYVARTPTRVVDTRIGLGAPNAPVAPAEVLAAQLAGANGLPAISENMPPTAVVTTVTLVQPSAVTFATVYPSLTSTPLASDINATANGIVPNLALPGLGADGKVAIFNSAGGSTQVIVDMSGYFIGGIHVPESTIELEAGAVAGISGDPAGAAAITLADDSPAPAVGEILSSGVTDQTPNGLMVKVTGVGTDGQGRPVVQTEPATLQEAIGSGDIAISVPMSAADVVANGAGLAAQSAHVLTTDDIGQRQLDPAGVTPVKGQKTTSSCTGDAESFVDTEFSIEPTLNIEIKLGWSGFRPTVKSKTYAQIKQTASVGFGYRAKATCTWERELAKFTFTPIQFFVGGVYVVIVPQLTVGLAAEMSGQAEISTSVTQEFVAKAGLSSDGSKVTPINEMTNTLTFQPPGITSATGTASASLSAELIGKFYGITGPTITVTATLLATVNPLANPWWTLLFTLTAKAGLKLEVSIVKISVETDEFILFSKILAQAGGNPNPSVTARLTFSEYAVGSLVGTQYQAQGIRFSGPTTPYISRDRDNPTSPVLSGGSGFGSELTGAFVNPDGSARSVSSLTLDVGYINQPGSTEVLAYNTAGALLQTAVANTRGIVTMTIQQPGIQSFIVRSTGVEDSGWGIDNVSFVGFTRPAGVNDLAAAGGDEAAGPTDGSTRGTS